MERQREIRRRKEERERWEKDRWGWRVEVEIRERWESERRTEREIWERQRKEKEMERKWEREAPIRMKRERQMRWDREREIKMEKDQKRWEIRMEKNRQRFERERVRREKERERTMEIERIQEEMRILEETRQQVCEICGEEKRVGEFVDLLLCEVGHWGGSYCRECLNKYLSIKIKECYSEINIKCVHPDCKSEIREIVIFEILYSNEESERKKLFEKYNQLKEQSTHNRQIYLKELFGNKHKTIEQLENTNWLLQHTKYCPSCFRLIEKGFGCNQMECCCGHSFCFGCGENMGSCQCDSESADGLRIQPLMQTL